LDNAQKSLFLKDALRKLKKEKNNEKIYSGYIHLFTGICLQQQLGEKASARVYPLFYRQGCALGRPSPSGPWKLIIKKFKVPVSAVEKWGNAKWRLKTSTTST
jgi:hypothetical protein